MPKDKAQLMFEEAGFKVIYVRENKNQPNMVMLTPTDEHERKIITGPICLSDRAWKKINEWIDDHIEE
jgi:hypothetical protein